VRASLALFEKSLNIPALHGPPSPKAQAAAAAAASPRGGIAAVRAMLPLQLEVVAAPAQLQQAAEELEPAAESLEGRGPGTAGASFSRRDRRQSFPLQPPAAAVADDGRRRSAAVQQLLSGVRETATGALPPAAPLGAAVGGLAGLGYGGSGGSDRDRESIWQQELSQELYRVKSSTRGAVAAGGGGVPNRRVSMHGSPAKRPSSIRQ
jgi:hypothetical protein